MITSRKRPYMLISYSKVPAANQKTNAANFKNEGEWDAVENMKIVDSISNKNQLYSDVVIDLLNQTVVKNRLGGDAKVIYDGYVKRYYDDIKDAMSDWIRQSPDNRDALQKFVEAHEAKNAGEANEQGDSN